MEQKTKAAGWHHAASKNILNVNPTDKQKHGQLGDNDSAIKGFPTPKEYYTNEVNGFSAAAHSGWASGLCPFHQDKNPSLSVNLTHGGFICFSCGEAGRGIAHFHSKKYKVPLFQALAVLKLWKAKAK